MVSSEASQSEIVIADSENLEINLIDVPLENQNGGSVSLENGCEITALSMLLRFYGYDTNKNDLSELLNYVPVYEDEENDIRGNPHEGFVGNIYEGYDAMGVSVEPIVKVVEQIVQDQRSIVASNETSFTVVADLVKNGTPVWVVATVDFEIPTNNDFRVWNTTKGEVKVSPLCHAAVVTGVDDQNVYVNDPYGYKNRIIDRQIFEEVFQRMGNQSLYLA